MVEIIRKSYLETMANYYMGSICTGPWTREWVREIMEMINTDDEVVIRKWNVYETNLKAVYINQLQGNRFALMRILKSSDNASNTVPVVPWEDSFDIIWNAHLVCSHGNITQTINLIKANYFINLVFVAKLLSGCYCKKEKIVSDLVVHYNIEGSLQILDMTAYPDKEFKYVLVYNDTHTGLTQLRPLVQVSQLEISMELVKIFTDLGPPKKLVVYEPYFYDNVINNVNKVFTPCKIELEFDVILNKNKLDEVSVMLNSWMKMNKSMNWTIGCNLVQWNMNINENHGKVPYHLVFGNYIYGKKKVKKKKKKKAPKNVSSTVAESISSTESDVECLFTTDSYECNENYNETGTNETDTNLDIEDIKLDIEDTNLDIANTNLDIEHTKLNTEETKDNNSMEYVDSQLNLQTEQLGSYQGEYLQFTANYTDKNVTKLPNNISTFHQNTEVNISDKDIAMPSDLGFNNKNDFASIEVNAFHNEKNVGQNHNNEVTTNKLLKTEYPSVTLSDEAQEETNASCGGIKHENIIETTFICWRCEKEVNCNDKIEDTRMDFTEIICQSCINAEESIT